MDKVSLVGGREVELITCEYEEREREREREREIEREKERERYHSTKQFLITFIVVLC